FVGGRFDRSERLANATPLGDISGTGGVGIVSGIPGGTIGPDGSLVQDTGGSLVLTYWPSEFSQIRGQLRRTSYGERLTANEFLFQFQFSIGAHGAHPF
ncbi:MAG TPA: hypothetical protein VGV35_11095, partial [Bryobacteraceae bacterium]|nr:hypothetical protein [Bryobacteraceae bacterium]